MSDPEPELGALRSAATMSKQRRRMTTLVVSALTLMLVMNLLAFMALGYLLYQKHRDDQRQARQARVGMQVITDLYEAVNFTNARLAELTGQKPPPPLVVPSGRSTPPSASTTTTVRATAATTTSTFRLASSTSGGQPASPSTTTATTTPTTVRPTTTTTRMPCVTVANLGVCLPARPARVRARASRGGSRTQLDWAALRQCESGGDYANRRNRTYRGGYQFSRATWASVGGSGDPADASPAEQDMRAEMLYQRSGRGQWPVCGRLL